MLKLFPFSKYFSVALITIGTAMCTLASADDAKDATASAAENEQNFFTWTLGISLLTFALFMSARMGIYQECLYQKHGKHPREALFFIHLMSLPGFLFSATDIMSYVYKFNETLPIPELSSPPSRRRPVPACR